MKEVIREDPKRKGKYLEKSKIQRRLLKNCCGFLKAKGGGYCKIGFYLFLIHIETETLRKYLIKIIKLVQFETEFKDHYHSKAQELLKPFLIMMQKLSNAVKERVILVWELPLTI